MTAAYFEDQPTDPEKGILRKPPLDQGADYERGFIDGMQKQAQSSVDKAVNAMSQRTWVDLTEEELRTAFGKLYPSDIGILELSENNKDYAVEAIGARHHWTAFKAGARAGEAKLKEKNT
jgi:hypothetical protein